MAHLFGKDHQPGLLPLALSLACQVHDTMSEMNFCSRVVGAALCTSHSLASLSQSVSSADVKALCAFASALVSL
jgi:hypothetical protein